MSTWERWQFLEVEQLERKGNAINPALVRYRELELWRRLVFAIGLVKLDYQEAGLYPVQQFSNYRPRSQYLERVHCPVVARFLAFSKAKQTYQAQARSMPLVL